MGPRMLGGAVFVTGLVALILLTLGGRRDPAAAGSSYAYVTEHSLVVIGNHVIVHLQQEFDPADSSQDKVVWTTDGRHLALFSDTRIRQEPDSNTELIGVDIATGAVTSTACPSCFNLTPIGRDGVLVAQAVPGVGTAYTEFYLGSQRQRSSQAAGPSSATDQVPTLLASTPNAILTAYGLYAGNVLEQELKVTVPGQRQILGVGAFVSNGYMLAAGRLAHAGSDFAVAFRDHPGECIAGFPIFLFEVRAGSVTKLATDLSATWAPGTTAGIDSGIEVHDLWWDSRGALHATISSWRCDERERTEDEKMRLDRPANTWTLRGTKWVSMPSPVSPTTSERSLAPNREVALSIPACTGAHLPVLPTVACNVGDLYRIEGTHTVQIADDVLAISTPPG